MISTSYCLGKYELENGVGSLEGSTGFSATVDCFESGFFMGTAPDCRYDDPDIDPECASLCDGERLDPSALIASYEALEEGCSDLLAVCDRQLATVRFGHEITGYDLDCEGYVDRWMWEMQQLGVDPITEEDECMLRAICDAGVTEYAVVQDLIAPTTLGARFECASRTATLEEHASLIDGWFADIAAAIHAARNAAFLDALAAEPVLESHLVVIRIGAAPHSEATAANQTSATCELYLESEIDTLVKLFMARTVIDAEDGECGDNVDNSGLRAEVADVQACGLAKGFTGDEAAKLQHLADALDAMDDFEDAFCAHLGAPGEPSSSNDFIRHVAAERSCFDACDAGVLGTQIEGVRLDTLYTGATDARGDVWMQPFGGADACAVPAEMSLVGCGLDGEAVVWLDEQPGEVGLLASFDPATYPPARRDGTCDRFDFSGVLEPLQIGSSSGSGGT